MANERDFVFHLPEGEPPKNLGEVAPDFSQGFLIALRLLGQDLPSYNDYRARESYDRKLNELYQTIIHFMADLERLGLQAALNIGSEPVQAETLSLIYDSPALFDPPKTLMPEETYLVNYAGFHAVYGNARDVHLPPLSVSTKQLFIGRLPEQPHDYSGYAISARQFSEIIQTGGHLSAS